MRGSIAIFWLGIVSFSFAPAVSNAASIGPLPSQGLRFNTADDAAAGRVVVDTRAEEVRVDGSRCGRIARVSLERDQMLGRDAMPVVVVAPLGSGRCIALVSTSSGSTFALPVAVALPRPLVTVAWQSIGPLGYGESGKLNALAIDTTHADTYYIGGGLGSGGEVSTDAGAFRTLNGGKTWTPINDGLSDRRINALWIDPLNADTLVAATQLGGIFRTTTRGSGWKSVSAGYPVTQLMQVGSILYAASSAGLIASKDQGATWTVVKATTQLVNAMGFEGSTIYLGLIDGEILEKTGGVWKQRTTLPSVGGFSPYPHQIVVQPGRPGFVYASDTGSVSGVYTQALYKSTNSGVSWKQLTLPAGIRGSQVMAFSKAHPSTLYVGGIQLYQTANGGASFTAVANGYGFGDERSLTVVAGPPDHLYIGSDQGFAISRDGGNSFTDITAPLSINVVRDIDTDGSTAITTIQDYSPFVTHDGGTTWMSPTIDSTENGDAYIDRYATKHCYVYNGGGGNLDASFDGCSTFSTIENTGGTESYVDTDTVAADPKKPGVIYLAGVDGILRSTDYGQTFASTGWPFTGPSRITIDQRDDNNIFVVTSANVSVTHDGGKTWAATNLPSAPYDGSQMVAVDPLNSKIVLGATGDYGGTEAYRSTDGGNTFTFVANVSKSLLKFGRYLPVYAGAPQGFSAAPVYFPSPNALAYDTQGSPRYAVLSTSMGAFVSTDDGQTWQSQASRTISDTFEGAVWSKGFLYVATDGQGVLRSTVALQSDVPRPPAPTFRLNLR